MFDKEKFKDFKFIKKLETEMFVFRDKNNLLKLNENSKLNSNITKDLEINNSENLNKFNFGLPSYFYKENVSRNKDLKKLK
jgi:hypothetical protein